MDIEIHQIQEPISKVDLAAIADVAMEAFLDDPFFEFLSPKEHLRRRGLRIFFRSFVQYLGTGRSVFIATRGDRIVGVAAWAPPGSYPASLREQVLQGIWALWSLLPRPKAVVDGFRYTTAMEKAHPKGELWYLALLAVHPELQRQGIGGKLIAPILELCDEQGIDVYLETQKQDNIAYYRRFGFSELEALRPVSAGPPLLRMHRMTKNR